MCITRSKKRDVRNCSDDFVDSLKSKLNIPVDKKVILYAPTWKDDEQNESWEHYFNLTVSNSAIFLFTLL